MFSVIQPNALDVVAVVKRQGGQEPSDGDNPLGDPRRAAEWTCLVDLNDRCTQSAQSDLGADILEL